MACHPLPWTLIPTALLLTATGLCQVFVVGEKTATADITTNMTPTRLELPTDPLTERGRRELVRNLEAEQGFARLALPMGEGVTLEANGQLKPGLDAYRQMIYRKGESAAPGDRIVITSVSFKGDRIVLDLNGGPYAKHRFLSHVSFNDIPIAAQPMELPTGCRVTLVFEGGIPEVSSAEVKSLLAPVLDFGVKTSEEAYADTLPAPLKDAIATHEVLVGMNRRMVLAALGAPETKIREHADNDPDGPRYEEWIYGHVPQTVRFIRFQGDKVTQVKIAAMGKPIEIHKTDELSPNAPGPETREIAFGDPTTEDEQSGKTARKGPPTLRQPGDPELPNSGGRVQFPTQKQPAASTQAPPASASSNDQ